MRARAPSKVACEAEDGAFSGALGEPVGAHVIAVRILHCEGVILEKQVVSEGNALGTRARRPEKPRSQTALQPRRRRCHARYGARRLKYHALP
jgi:hypothetical protein